MTRCLLTVLACGLLVWTPALAAGPTVQSNLKGEWALIVWDFEGYWFTAVDGPIGDNYRDLRFTFTANRMKIKVRQQGQRLGWDWDGLDTPYEIDATKDPKEIDIDDFGTGIYSLSGDRLVICLARDKGAKRPSTFELRPAGANTLLLLERVRMPAQ